MSRRHRITWIDRQAARQAARKAARLRRRERERVLGPISEAHRRTYQANLEFAVQQHKAGHLK